MKPHILYLTYDGLTSIIGQSQIWPYLSGLVALGYRFTVISHEAPDRWAKIGLRVKSDIEAAGITWVPRPFRSSPPIVSKLVDQTDLLLTAFKTARKSRFDIVHCRSYVTAQAGFRLKQWFGCRFVFDMRGFWVDERVEGGRWPQERLFFRILYKKWKRREATFIRASDAIIALTESAAREIESWPSYASAIVAVIPCSVDFDKFQPPPERAQVRKVLRLPDHAPVLVYLGSLGTVYRLDEMLQFFSALKRRLKDARFLFIGSYGVDDILPHARQLGLTFSPDDFRFVACEHTDVPRWLTAADLAIGFRQATYSSKAASPTKLGEYFACGLPAVCNSGVGDVAEIVEQLQAGVVLPDFHPDTIEAAAEKSLALMETDRQSLRQRACPVFDLRNAIAAYARTYDQLLCS